ncbi:MAG TPA: efflux RND transporter periplasmic adaptor subunit [Bacteroidia bacterium]|nr:efflux RND transporter periplasmic adaptor subunit [Bacteroidia bacterium]HNT79367.1 efflux RND transporter periplasmic adaptor subunit [Bacteroidia bacterium]
MKNKKVKIAVWTGAILIVLLTIAKSMGWLGASDAMEVSTEKAGSRDIIEIVTASGKIQPETELRISADVSGEIVELAVSEGDVVKQGDLLVKIKPDIYESNMDRMNAQLLSSKANVENSKSRLAQTESRFVVAEKEFNRYKKLFEDKVVSASEFENIKTNFEVAKAEVDAASQSVKSAEFQMRSSQASVKEANENLLKTSIYAAVSGTVSKLSKEKGERVVGTNMMEGTEILRLANLREMEVSVDVNENDILRVQKGDTSIIEIDAYPDRDFKGVVTEVANSANILGLSTDQVTNFTVKIRILKSSYEDLVPKDNPNYSPFRPGMTANVDIQTRKANNVIAIPVQAVTTRDTTKSFSSSGESESENTTSSTQSNNVTCVFIVHDGKASMKVVETGIQDDTYIEIKSGVNKEDEIIKAPYSAISKLLKEGKDVKVISEEELFKKK